jgi:hypothetical protein
MALWVFDTDHLSLFQRGYPRLLPRIQAIPATQIAISIVSVEEMLQGRLAQIRRAANGEDQVRAYAWLDKTLAFFRAFRSLEIGPFGSLARPRGNTPGVRTARQFQAPLMIPLQSARHGLPTNAAGRFHCQPYPPPAPSPATPRHPRT